VNDATDRRGSVRADARAPPEVEVLIDVPRGGFPQRGSTDHIDFDSPLPCPFTYGSVPSYAGLEGALLDAVIPGPRRPFGARTRVKAWGAIVLTDRGMTDHRLIGCNRRPDPSARRWLPRFFPSTPGARGCSTSDDTARAETCATDGARPVTPSPSPNRRTSRGTDR
jgi:inorganic pyrophosphatase